MGSIVDLLSWIATPLFYAVSGILVAWHKLWTTIGLDSDGGWSWVLAIVGLTITIRAMLIPLFVRQIKSSRNMQLIQPKVKELQKKYGHDRQRLAEETMKLYKDAGTNPFASCMPLLLQMPIFLVLFRMLNEAARNEKGHGFLTDTQATQLANADWLGSNISDQFLSADHISTQILAGFLVVVMIVSQFLTQRQLMAKNMPPEAMSGQFAQQQKLLLYVLPLVFAVSGLIFPIGLLIYWTTSNIWTMGQQFYVIRNNPAPGTEAEKAKQERDKAKARRKGIEVEEDLEPVVEERRPAERQQPKRQSRSQRKGGGQSQPSKNKKKNKRKGGRQ